MEADEASASTIISRFQLLSAAWIEREVYWKAIQTRLTQTEKEQQSRVQRREGMIKQEVQKCAEEVIDREAKK